MKAVLLSAKKLPSHFCEEDKNSGLYHILIYDNSDSLIDYFALGKDDPKEDILNWLNRMYSEGAREYAKDTLPPQKLAYLSYRVAEGYRHSKNHDTPGEKATLVRKAALFDKAAHRYLKGYQVSPLYDDEGVICAYYVVGDSSASYRVSLNLDSCTCPPGIIAFNRNRTHSNCWHVAMVEVYKTYVESINRSDE